MFRDKRKEIVSSCGGWDANASLFFGEYQRKIWLRCINLFRNYTGEKILNMYYKEGRCVKYVCLLDLF